MEKCPYVGLVPYSKKESEFFFGREDEREIIASNLCSSRLTLVYGPSGVGKSSVLGAGVESDLRQRAVDSFLRGRRPRFIPVLFNSWYVDPLAGINAQIDDTVREIKTSVRRITSKAPEEQLKKTAELLSRYRTRPAVPPDDLVTLAKTWSKRLGCVLLIILDQFEDFFLYHPGAGRFADGFAEAVNQDNLGCNFLISIREDELARLDPLGSRIPRLFQNKYAIKHLSRRSAEAAIRGPVGRFNELNEKPGVSAEIDDELVSDVLDAIQVRGPDGGAGEGGTACEAPFLQLVMTHLWEEAAKEGDGRHYPLRSATLRRLGGVNSLIETHLDRVMEKLSDEQREMAARVFSHLATPTNRRMTHSVTDLEGMINPEGERRYPRAQLESLLDVLKTAPARILRPLSLPSVTAPGEKFYQISHDILAENIRKWQTRYVRAAHEREAREARRAARRAFSRDLAAAAVNSLKDDPERSLMLALYATEVGEEVGEPATAESEEALLNALQASRVRLTLTGHSARLWAVAYDRTGDRLATSSEDGTAAVWDARTGERLMVFNGHRGWVMGVAFHPDGTEIITAGEDGTAQTWEVATGRRLQVWNLSSKPLNAVAYDREGRRFAAAGDDGGIWIHTRGDEDPRRLVHEPQGGAVDAVAFSPDGKQLASAGEDMRVRLWDVESGEMTTKFNGHKDRIKAVAYAPGGSRLATAGHDGTVKIWSLPSPRQPGKLRRTIPIDYFWLTSIAFSPDGTRLVTVGRGKDTATVWDADSGQPVLTLLGHGADVRGVAFSPDGERVATASCDRTAKVWQVADDRPLILYTHQAEVKSIAYSPDGGRLATGGNDKAVKVWAADTGRLLYDYAGHRGDLSGVCFSPDGRLLATAGWDRTLALLDADTGRELFRRERTEHLLAVAFSPDGRLLATSGTDRVPRVFRVVGDKSKALSLVEVSHLEGHKKWVNGLAFSPDSRLLASSSDDKTIRVWELETGTELCRHRGGDFFQGVAFGRDGGRAVLLAASHDGTALVWDFTSDTPPRRLVGHTKTLHHVASSPDGRLAATASEDCTVRVWEVSSGELKRTLAGHADVVWHAAFSPDGERLATASLDRTARVWDVRSGEEILTLNRSEQYSKPYHPEPESRLYGLKLNEMRAMARKHLTRPFTEQECRKYLHLGDCRAAPDLTRSRESGAPTT